jgi:hypothetical protein
VIVLNHWNGETGQIENNIKDAPVRVGLGEVPSTPAYRMQQQNTIATIVQALAQTVPQAAAVLGPSFIESTDLPDRMERADDLRRMLGMPTAGDKQRSEKMAAMAEREQQRKQALGEADAKLTLEEKAAKVGKLQSEAELNEARVVEIGHDMGAAHMPAPQRPEPPDPQQQEDALINASLQEAMQAVAA